MMVFGSDGVERLRGVASSVGMVSIDSRELRSLILYYDRLTKLCGHEWDVTSPIDSMQVCRKCGLVESC